jgi:glucuronoarabinoxylan endo-1,4-beta-xylanase
MGTNMPKMLVPETAGFSGLSTYIDQLVDRSHAYGYAHHLYNGGGSYAYPDGYIDPMKDFRKYYGDKPRMQTEFAKLGAGDVTTFDEAMNLAHVIHNSLVFEDVSIYCYWELFWEWPKGLVTFPGFGVYRINPVYYAFKQYSAFTNPGWRRVGASTSLGERGDVRISAFKSPDNRQLTIVIINLAYNNINLTLDVNGFSPDSSEIYRTSETEHTAYIGPYYEQDSLMLPARSITTIHSPVLSNCANVLAAGYGLTSDIYHDCYVNFKDLKIITDYWLNINCTEPDNCEGADFEPTDGGVNLLDLSTFAKQWMWCNDPEGPDCKANWP